jgi:type IV fimbrial biogenesis protein FimT
VPSIQHRPRGLSWAELLAVLAIVAVLAALAAPSFMRLRANAASLAASQALLGALHLARSQAMLRGQPTALCLSADGRRCLGDARRGQGSGWLVFVDRVRGQSFRGPPQFDAGDVVVARYDTAARLRLHGTRPAVTYWPVSRAGTTATFTICTPEVRVPRRAIVVSQSGRPRLRQDGRNPGPCDA